LFLGCKLSLHVPEFRANGGRATCRAHRSQLLLSRKLAPFNVGWCSCHILSNAENDGEGKKLESDHLDRVGVVCVMAWWVLVEFLGEGRLVKEI
jgi:hypothetical protein